MVAAKLAFIISSGVEKSLILFGHSSVSHEIRNCLRDSLIDILLLPGAEILFPNEQGMITTSDDVKKI